MLLITLNGWILPQTLDLRLCLLLQDFAVRWKSFWLFTTLSSSKKKWLQILQKLIKVMDGVLIRVSMESFHLNHFLSFINYKTGLGGIVIKNYVNLELGSWLKRKRTPSVVSWLEARKWRLISSMKSTQKAFPNTNRNSEKSSHKAQLKGGFNRFQLS